MSYIGYVPAAKPLTSADITDGIITNADIASGAAIAQSKIAGSFGKVLQVVSTTYSTTMTTTSGTYADMNLSLSITPSSASNKVLVLSCTSTSVDTGGADAGGGIIVLRNSTVINGGNADYTFYNINSGGAADTGFQYHSSALDSPNTTSAITYKCQFAAFYGGTFRVHRSQPSYIIAMEIAA